jgi:hypothetical protein
LGTSYENIGVIAKNSEMTLKTPKNHEKWRFLTLL